MEVLTHQKLWYYYIMAVKHQIMQTFGDLTLNNGGIYTNPQNGDVHGENGVLTFRNSMI
jgi:hypothetical protein